MRHCITTLLLAVALLAIATTAPAQSLTTLFAGNNGNAGNMFDIRSVGAGVNINDFDINLSPGTTTIEVWIVTGGGSLVGNETNPAAWSMVASVPITSNGADVPTPLGLASNPAYTPVFIPPAQTQGFCIIGTNLSLDYTNGSNFGMPYASDSNIEILEGYGMAYDTINLQPNFTGTLNGNPATGDSRIWNGTVYYTPISGLSDDLLAIGISQPVDSADCDPLTTTEPVEMSIVNIGSNPVTSGSLVDFSFSVDGGTPVVESILMPVTLNQGDSYTHTFTATADLSIVGPHSIDVAVTYPADLDPSNDTSSKTVFSGGTGVVQSFPWFENFDGSVSNGTLTPPVGWVQDQTDATGSNSDWYFRNTATGSVNTGPVGGADHTSGTGYYAHVEDTGNFAQVNLDSPCIDLAAQVLTNPRLIFYTHSFNASTTPTTTNENFLSVDIITYPGGVVTMDAFGPYGHDTTSADYASSDWRFQAVDLAPFNLQTIRVRFRGRSDGGSTTHDIAIDDVGIGDVMSGTGQPGRPGLALLDLNNAVNAFFGNGGPASGDNGPFVTSATVGGDLAFVFNGEPNSAFAWLIGTLNEGVATFPGTIGNFDIGTTLNPSTGIPVDIGIIGDGFNPFDFISGLCRTDATGSTSLTFVNNGLGPGFQTSFQCAFQTTADQGGGVFPAFIALSNAVQLTVQ